MSALRTIVGTILVFSLCGLILAFAVWSGFHDLWGRVVRVVAYSMLAVAIYWSTRWIRGPGSELGTPVPSLDLAERTLNSDSSSRAPR